ncbi:hypothetical protein BO71DRAFT_466632 [Aspergillus ellipticus CBS 707.79]|uniref:Rhodanese domain-containing protein n=1 Tax=Aspergillus ellipticus CBS 707.79 TaxID=1448320 RepID=A0A319CUS1_9EURO|nr:hypothetical protein BO71DRAFT_466632 [Aspergillus ellipticus CBS 707.79]
MTTTTTTSTMNAFTTPVINPSEYHHATTTTTSSPNSPRIIPLAAYLPALHASFSAAHLPHSRFLDMTQTRDLTSPYPSMLPPAPLFHKTLSSLAIRPTDTLVLYDATDIGTYHAPRLAFMCRFFGHRGGVHVLNNFREYVGQGYPISSGEICLIDVDVDLGKGVKSTSEKREGGYTLPNKDEGGPYNRVIGFSEMRDIVLRKDRRVKIVDSRVPALFHGSPGVSRDEMLKRGGHMCGAVNVPLAAVLEPVSGAVLSKVQLRDVLSAVGVIGAGPFGEGEIKEEGEGEREWVFTCNSGVTAAALDLVFEIVGVKGRRRVYDGSWGEWGRRVDEGDGDGLVVFG